MFYDDGMNVLESDLKPDSQSKAGPAVPSHDCPLCPRLVAYRSDNRAEHPEWFNGPVPAFGSYDARLLIVGLAPGVRGANRTGRPFTGDYAGDLLYATLLDYGFATGHYAQRPDDGLTLIDCAILNSVRCVPPHNKPLPEEIATCRRFLTATIEAMPNLRAIVALGRIAHESLLRAAGEKLSAWPFAHGRAHRLTKLCPHNIELFDSYHCSRYNTNTGVLTPTMFRDVFAQVRTHLDGAG